MAVQHGARNWPFRPLAVKENGITEHIMSRESDFLQNSIIKSIEPREVEMVGKKLYTRLVVVLPTAHVFGIPALVRGQIRNIFSAAGWGQVFHVKTSTRARLTGAKDAGDLQVFML